MLPLLVAGLGDAALSIIGIVGGIAASGNPSPLLTANRWARIKKEAVQGFP
ncbi:hypothetical protein NKJ90_03995 [Mesorhizobium sp. M0051]|uniref:hypothetical protein n=1 Tax=unclassified Mesorhizobium TaxID=325217 RepID=UPI0012EBC03F|nr:hypothetical protein [Mesorhizobium sp. LNHC252B00]